MGSSAEPARSVISSAHSDNIFFDYGTPQPFGDQPSYPGTTPGVAVTSVLSVTPVVTLNFATKLRPGQHQRHHFDTIFLPNQERIRALKRLASAKVTSPIQPATQKPTITPRSMTGFDGGRPAGPAELYSFDGF